MNGPSPAPASDPLLDHLLGPPRDPSTVHPVDRSAARAQVEALVTGRPVVLIAPAQVDAFARFLRRTGDQLDGARDHLRGVADAGADAPPELGRVIADVARSERLLGTTARSLAVGTTYAGRVADLGRRADAGGGVNSFQVGKAGKSLVTLAAKPSLGGGIGAATKAIHAAVGMNLVGRTAEVVVDALTGAAKLGVTGAGARGALAALGEGLRRVVVPLDDLERLRDGVELSPEAGRGARLLAKIARVAGPAGFAIDALSGVKALDDVQERGLKASNGLTLGSAATGLGSAALAFTAPWAALGLGGVSLLTGGGSIFAKGKEEAAERRRAEAAWQAKLRRNPNTTDFLRGQGPPPDLPRLRPALPPLRPAPDRPMPLPADLPPLTATPPVAGSRP